jgi:hypothetical protein
MLGDFKPKRFTDGPEAVIQRQLTEFLKIRDWMVKPTMGNMFQAGFPDLYCAHRMKGARWIEVKLPDMKGSRFTPAQLSWFPQFSAAGVGIWILTAATEFEYSKLFSPPNWQMYHHMMR